MHIHGNEAFSIENVAKAVEAAMQARQAREASIQRLHSADAELTAARRDIGNETRLMAAQAESKAASDAAWEAEKARVAQDARLIELRWWEHGEC